MRPKFYFEISSLINISLYGSTEDRFMIRRWPAEYDQELHPKPKFLVTAKAYLSTTFIENILDFIDLCPHWGSVGCLWE